MEIDQETQIGPDGRRYPIGDPAPPAPLTERELLGNQQLDAASFKGYEQINVDDDDAVELTVPEGATKAVVAVEAQAARYRLDGADNAPTSAVGVPVAAGEKVLLLGGLADIRFIGQVNGAILNVNYF